MLLENVTEELLPKIQTIAKESELNAHVFRALAMRERAGTRSDIDAIFRELESNLNKELDYFKFIDVWKSLENQNLGTLVHGRKGNPSRFVWKVNFRHMARTALGLPLESTPAFRTNLRPGKRKKRRGGSLAQSGAGHQITFVLPPTVPYEEIMKLMALGATLSSGKAKTAEEDAE